MSKKLSEFQQKFVEAMPADQDIDIAVLYIRVYGDDQKEMLPPSVREMQQKMAQVIKNINAKIKPRSIDLGETKRTYRLNTNGK